MPRFAGAGLSTSEIEVTIADGVRDIDEALTVIHDGFVEAGYLTPRPSGRRMHPAYLNPGTIFLVARIDGETAATCAIIADGPFGLPSDRAFVEENDAMRAECPGVLRECGSLAVSGAHRRHTRRLVMRSFAAVFRVVAAEFPESPVVMAVTPDNERFYGAVTGAVRVAGPRPLYGAPAVLLRTGVSLARHCARGTTPTQRSMGALFDECDPAWIRDRRVGAPLPADWLEGLLEEHGVTEVLGDQLRLLSAGSPDALARIVRHASRQVAA